MTCYSLCIISLYKLDINCVSRVLPVLIKCNVTFNQVKLNKLSTAVLRVLYVCIRVYDLLSCRSRGLSELLESPFVRRAVAGSEECAARGLDLREGAPYPALPPYRPRPINYLQAFLPSETLVTLCNLLAVSLLTVLLFS